MNTSLARFQTISSYFVDAPSPRPGNPDFVIRVIGAENFSSLSNVSDKADKICEDKLLFFFQEFYVIPGNVHLNQPLVVVCEYSVSK